MKKLTILFVLVSFAFALTAGEWEKTGDLSLNLTQNSYSDNWFGDEKSNISWALNMNLSFQKQINDMLHNKNNLKFAFGQTHTQEIDDEGEKYWEKPSKTTDLIDIESLMRFTMGWFVDPFAGLRFESKFLDETDPEETKMINPITLTESFGFARWLIKEDKKELSTRFGAAFKQYMNSHDSIDNTNDGGLEFVAEYFTPLLNDMVQFNSKLNIYKALYYSESDDSNDDWKAVDVNWENIMSAKISKYININFYLQMLYDKQIEDELRTKQTLGLGISYQLF